ncbi:MAG: MlaD family protein [candidate division WOR-3 bacterium]|nr:MlaD family protein [candidate division WOR-3 bacterium]
MNYTKKIVIFIFIFAISLIIFFSYLYLSGNLRNVSGYKIDVYFSEVSELKKGSPVMVRGIEKGKVNKIELADDNQLVRVQITIDNDIKLTEDSKFAIRSLSYFGTDKILCVTPGLGKPMTKTTKFYGVNEVIQLEKVFISLENIIAKIDSLPLDQSIHDIKTELTKLYSKVDTLARAFSSPLINLAGQLSDLVIRLDSLHYYFKQSGTITKLMASDELYQEIRNTNLKLQELIEDIKTNPQKYFSVKLF